MSWFVEISEKAENILNKIDRNAAKALNNQSNVKPSSSDDSSIRFNISSTATSNNVQSGLSDSFSNQPDTADLFPNKSRAEPTKEVFNNAAESQFNSSAAQKKFVYDNLRSEMLQNEIHSLNNEISLLLNRTKLEEQKSRDLSAQLAISREKNVTLEEQLANLRSRRFSKTDVPDTVLKITEHETNCSKNNDGDNNDSRPSNLHEHYDAQIQELLQEKNTLMDTLREKEDEIILLKSRLSKKTYCFSADELQSRLRALTITLVEKQSAVESLMLEKNNLLIKLNQLQGRYEEALGILKQSRINVNDTDDVKALIPVYGSGGNFTRHIGKLYTALTRMSQRNRFSLRTVSVWRLSLIIYIIFMHGLVFLLLYSHAPESTDLQTKD